MKGLKRSALKIGGKAILALIAAIGIVFGADGCSKKKDDVHPLYGAPDTTSTQYKSNV
ncbi:MAG: hypothetical protein ACM3U1_08890 [Chloroflexota bacterium]